MPAINMVTDVIAIEKAEIGFRNFSGKENRFNKAGNRNFCVFLDMDLADRLKSDGWNIKYLVPRDPDEERQAYMQVAVAYENFPPAIVVITDDGQTMLNEETVETLDWADIANIDLIIRPYNWDVNGKHGVKAYLKKMYVTIRSDPFAKKYSRTSPKEAQEDGD